MFLVKANTVIQVPVATSISLVRWRPYTTSEDKLYDKEQVWDAVAVHNGLEDIPDRAVQNITEHGNVVLRIGNKFARCKPSQLEYLD